METILQFFYKILYFGGPFIILLGLLIFVHELGHFLVARYFGVRVEVFSLGFGKKIWSKKSGDTTYALSLIPLGGYVKMFGDEVGGEILEEEKKFSFLHKPVLQRIGIAVAGPIMNLLFAILLFFVVFQVGENTRAPILGDIESSSMAYSMGFRSGDKIIAVDESEMTSWSDFQKILANSVGNKLVVTVKRDADDKLERLEASPTLVQDDNPLRLSKEIGSIPGLTTVSRAPAIGITSSDSQLGRAGLKTGDLITHINDLEIKRWREIEKTLRSLTGPIKIKAIRGFEKEKGEERIEASLVLPQDRITTLLDLGLEPADLYLNSVISDSPAMKAGLQKGDRIYSVDGKQIISWDQLLSSVKGFKEENKFIKFEMLRDGKVLPFDIVPQISQAMSSHGLQENRYTIGIVPWVAQDQGAVVNVKTNDIGQALIKAFQRTYDVSMMTVVSFIKLFKAEISARNISGVISIGQAAGETFKLGLSQFLSMMGLISVNLFILNLLPIPVLDGGHLVFYTIELIKGSPLSLKKMELAQRAGFAVLMSLMAFALFNDIARIFSN